MAKSTCGEHKKAELINFMLTNNSLKHISCLAVEAIMTLKYDDICPLKSQ